MANKPHIPLVPLRGTVVFPNVVMHLDIGRKVSIDAVEQAMAGDRLSLIHISEPTRPY